MGRYRAKNIAGILERLLGQRKYQKGLREAEISTRWAEIAGDKLAQHSHVAALRQNRLEIACDHDVWRAEMHFLKPQLLSRIADCVGEGVVKEIQLK